MLCYVTPCYFRYVTLRYVTFRYVVISGKVIYVISFLFFLCPFLLCSPLVFSSLGFLLSSSLLWSFFLVFSSVSYLFVISSSYLGPLLFRSKKISSERVCFLLTGHIKKRHVPLELRAKHYKVRPHLKSWGACAPSCPLLPLWDNTYRIQPYNSDGENARIQGIKHLQ